MIYSGQWGVSSRLNYFTRAHREKEPCRVRITDENKEKRNR